MVRNICSFRWNREVRYSIFVMDSSLHQNSLKTLIDIALWEDSHDLGDITSQATIDDSTEAIFVFRAREEGILSGSEVAISVLRAIDEDINIQWSSKDGDFIGPSVDIAIVEGNLRSILKAERICLNFLSHLSGIATQTRIFVDLLAESGSRSIVRDTRKTTPGYRSLEKSAVVHGGGQNHRMGLYDAFLIKDNHVNSASIVDMVKKCRKFDGSKQLEVEVDSIGQLKEVIPFLPDLIMLDNFSVDQILEAISISPGTKFEVSGGVNLENLIEYGSTNVDFIAIGALTHSSVALDIGLDAK